MTDKCRHRWHLFKKGDFVHSKLENGNLITYFEQDPHTFICDKCGRFKKVMPVSEEVFL